MEQRPKSKLSTAALVMGILCVVFSLLPFGGLIFGLLGLIFSIVCLAKKKGSKAKSVWGLVLSIVGSALRVIGILIGGLILLAGGTIGIMSLGSIITFLAPILIGLGMENLLGYNLEDLSVLDEQDISLISFADEDDDNGLILNLDNDDSGDWRFDYLPSDNSFEYEGFTFTLPEAADDYGINDEDYIDDTTFDWYVIGLDEDLLYFPMTVLEYEEDNYSDAYESILSYWYEMENGYDMYVTWHDEDVHEWNDDWVIAEIEYDNGSFYSYDLVAFSTHTNKVVLLAYYPIENEYMDKCLDVRYLLNYIEY